MCNRLDDRIERDLIAGSGDIDLGSTKDISSTKHFPKTNFGYRHLPAVRLIEHISIEEVYKLRQN